MKRSVIHPPFGDRPPSSRNCLYQLYKMADWLKSWIKNRIKKQYLSKACIYSKL